jgi:hypothetical protein
MPFSGLAQIKVDREQFAIAISDGEFGAHIAIAFHAANESLSLIHLLEHLTIKVEQPSDTKKCWAACVVDTPNVLGKQVVALIRAVEPNPPKISYGLALASVNGSFDTLGRYVAPPGSDGLTCASFVSEILKGAGLNLIDLNTWPTTFENIEWGNSVIKFIEKRGASPEHLATLGKNNKGLRLHPFEVAAAAESHRSAWPLNYSAAHGGMGTIRSALAQICPLGLRRAIMRALGIKVFT